MERTFDEDGLSKVLELKCSACGKLIEWEYDYSHCFDDLYGGDAKLGISIEPHRCSKEAMTK